MYSISIDNELKKDGQMCYCVNGETSCTALCAAFEEMAKGRVTLHCVKHSLIAPREVAVPVIAEVDPLADLTAGLEEKASPAPVTKAKAKKGGKK